MLFIRFLKIKPVLHLFYHSLHPKAITVH